MKLGKTKFKQDDHLQKIIPIHCLINTHLQIPLPLHLPIVLLVSRRYHLKKNRNALFKVLDFKITISSIKCKKSYTK